MNNVWGVTGKTDLLGSFSLHILYARIFCDYFGNKLNFTPETNFKDFTDTGAKNLYLKNKEDYEKHIYFRKTICNALITSNLLPSINIGDTSKIEEQLKKIGFTLSLNKTRDEIRESVLKQLPEQNYLDTTKKLIVIHFRSGEIINMNNRYIHSNNYKDLISNFKRNMPDYKIVVFTSIKPSVEHDDLKAFEGLKIYCENEIQNILQIWRIFIESSIFIIARSGFSYTPALLRKPEQKTYCPTFWHSIPDYWETWFDDSVW